MTHAEYGSRRLPDDATQTVDLSADERERLARMQVRDPDEIIEPARGGMLGKAFVGSILCHILILGATSIALFRDWSQYGLALPSQIRETKEEQKAAAEQESRENVATESKQPSEDTPSGEGDLQPGDDEEDPGNPPADSTTKPAGEETADPLDSFNFDAGDLGLE